jgi:hypothetical protein
MVNLLGRRRCHGDGQKSSPWRSSSACCRLRRELTSLMYSGSSIGGSADKDFVKTLILGIEDGFEAANDELKANGKPMLYCAPEAIKFTGDQLVEILRRWVDTNRVKAPRLDAAPPATALLYALEDAFPCR